jgi:hypothetical protein
MSIRTCHKFLDISNVKKNRYIFLVSLPYRSPSFLLIVRKGGSHFSMPRQKTTPTRRLLNQGVDQPLGAHAVRDVHLRVDDDGSSIIAGNFCEQDDIPPHAANVATEISARAKTFLSSQGQFIWEVGVNEEEGKRIMRLDTVVATSEPPSERDLAVLFSWIEMGNYEIPLARNKLPCDFGDSKTLGLYWQGSNTVVIEAEGGPSLDECSCWTKFPPPLLRALR